MRKLYLMTTLVFASVAISMSAGAQTGIWDDLDHVYFGDFHVHTDYSLDAWAMGNARGRYADEAGMYATYCSKIDFYSVTDHAEYLTDSGYWKDSIKNAQKFNDLGRSLADSSGDPRIVAFTGWEWTQPAPWGHKNIILKHDDPDLLPESPIRCFKGYQGWRPYGYLHGYIKAQHDQRYWAPTPKDLFSLLRETCTDAGTGCDAVVIPHGNAWGFANMQTSWTVQMDPKNHDPELQQIIEIYSKHGNSEEYKHFPPGYRYYRGGTEVSEDQCSDGGCEKVCSPPTDSFEPCCHRAGLIVAERCVDPDSDFCKEEIEKARQSVVPFAGKLARDELSRIKPEFRKDPGYAFMKDWRACDQCLECYQPAFRYNTNGSVQRAMVTTYFHEDGTPLHYKFGFIGSTDTHMALPGSVKETKQNLEQTFWPGLRQRFPEAARSLQTRIGGIGDPTGGPERISMMFNPGSLVAIISPHRTADHLWESLQQRRIYSTTGPRIEVWAKARVTTGLVEMGSESVSNKNPVFHIKVNGAFEEDPTCPYEDEPDIRAAFSPEEFERVCQSQCYRTLDTRTPIDRIEVVKVLQPLTPGEAGMDNFLNTPQNPNGLIFDPYYVADFNDSMLEWTWTDEKFLEQPTNRSVAYYFRIIQVPTEGYSCGPIAMLERGEGCNTYDPLPAKVEARANPQDGSAPEPLNRIADKCYTDPDDPTSYCRERAVTSPFYITRK